MKRRLLAATYALSALAAFPVIAEMDDDIYGMEQLLAPEAEIKGGPFEFQVDADLIGNMDITNPGYEGQHLTFKEVSALLRMVFYYDPCNREALYVAGNYSYVKLWWEQDPLVQRKYFNTASVALGFFSNRLCDWIWQGQIEWRIDTDYGPVDRYSTYDGILWGKYEYNNCTHIHVGVIAQTGMKWDRVYPILGFDRKITDKIDLNVVFPVNMSIVYNLTDEFRLMAGTRFFSNRFRGAPTDPQPESVIGFTTTGFEFGATYEVERQFKVNLHAGYTLGGELRIANSENQHQQYYNLNNAFYWGGEASVSF